MVDIDIMKLRRLDFALLLVFREIIRHGKASVAAERLGLSQPAVSHALARLRDLTGDPLFLRRPNGFQPTPAAVALAPKVEALLALADDAMGAARRFDPGSSTRLFRISANDFTGPLLTAPLIADFGTAAPAARLAFSFNYGPAGFKALHANELDVMLGRFDALPDGLVALRLFEDDYRVIARANHPELRAGLDLQTYLALGHLVVSFTGELQGTVEKKAADGIYTAHCRGLADVSECFCRRGGKRPDRYRAGAAGITLRPRLRAATVQTAFCDRPDRDRISADQRLPARPGNQLARCAHRPRLRRRGRAMIVYGLRRPHA